MASVGDQSVDAGSNERELIEHYFSKGYKYDVIVKFLSKYHGIQMCQRTLKNRLRQYGLRRRMPDYDIDEVRERIQRELDGPGCMGGYRSVWHTLRLEHLQVPRCVVEELMRELDPEGCKLRQAKRLKRRKYSCRGPNDVWHVDGYDKIKPYGFPIHGCIDGWSRRIMWLRVSRTNNNPEVVATFFLETVEEVGGCPVKVRTDCGTENGVIAAMQCEFRQDLSAHKYGTSPANQRIEGWWAFYRRNRSTWWINFFKDLVHQGFFNPGNQLQMECMWFCFSNLIQSDLDQVKEHWNSHCIRASRHDSVSGRPDELYFLPECHGGEVNLIASVTEEQVESVEGMCTDVEPTLEQEYFAHVMENTNFEQPKDWEEGLTLYQRLLQIAAEGYIQ